MMTVQGDSKYVTEGAICYTFGKHITCLIMCSKCRLRFVFSGKMYTGNGINHLTCHAHGLSTYQLPVEGSLVSSPPTKKQVKTSPV